MTINYSITLCPYDRAAIVNVFVNQNWKDEGTYGMLSRMGVSFALFYLRSGYKKHAQYLPRQREGKVNEHLEELKGKCFFIIVSPKTKEKGAKLKNIGL